jgi:hypothetical protein
MIEVYAFLAIFTMQILAMSILHPAWLSRYVRAKATDIPDEYFAQRYPGVDRHRTTERFLSRYRAANAVIAVIGVLLLGWMFSYMRHPDWQEDPVIILLSVYFVIQMSPLLLLALITVRYRKVRMHFLEGKRKAILQRRGLFDFVSPFIVFLAVLGYFLFVAFVIYLQSKPFPGFALIGVLTLVYILEAFFVYAQLYGKKGNPFETHAGRAHTIGQAVKSGVYGCILCVVFFSFIFTIDLLDHKRWVPFAQSVFLVISTLLCFMGLTAPPRQPEGLDSDGRLTPGARDLSA